MNSVMTARHTETELSQTYKVQDSGRKRSEATSNLLWRPWAQLPDAYL